MIMKQTIMIACYLILELGILVVVMTMRMHIMKTATQWIPSQQTIKRYFPAD
jgi:hypothetical protein